MWLADTAVGGHLTVLVIISLQLHSKAARFKRNDRMLDIVSAGVIIFPSSGITGNLADKATKLGVRVGPVDGKSGGCMSGDVWLGASGMAAACARPPTAPAPMSVAAAPDTPRKLRREIDVIVYSLINAHRLPPAEPPRLPRLEPRRPPQRRRQ